MSVKSYEGEPRYILETSYGCCTQYGWAFTCASNEFESAKMKFEKWKKIPGNYRLIDNTTSRVIM